MGGNSGLSHGENNAAISLMTVPGTCGSYSSNSIEINELTTVSSVWALTAFMRDATHLGSSSNDTAFDTAVSYATLLTVSGASARSGGSVPPDLSVPIEKLNALSNLLATCVRSSGGRLGDGSPCGQLFAVSYNPSATPPMDTISAGLGIASNPTSNVIPIFNLLRPQAAYTPTLQTAPADWSLPVRRKPPVPVINPDAGRYASGTTITMSSSTVGAVLRYTLDGRTPNLLSQVYTGPIVLSKSETVSVVAFAGMNLSDTASEAYTVFVPHLIFSNTPQTITFGSYITPAPIVSIVDDLGAVLPAERCRISIALNGTGAPLSGVTSLNSISGIAEFGGLFISKPGSYSLKATCPLAGSIDSSVFNIASPSISLTPTVLTIPSGAASSIRLHLSAAPAQPVTVTLVSSPNRVLGVLPDTALIPIGQTDAEFALQGRVVGTATLSATANGYTSDSASISVAAAPNPSFTISPSTIAVIGAQTQQFIARIGSTLTGDVRWSLNPSIGSISPSGLYTPPTSSTVSQSVVVTATSNTDSTRSASATISVSIPIPSTFIGLSVGDYVDLHPALHFGTTRSWDGGGIFAPISWADLNPSAGVYKLSAVDKYVEFNKRGGSQGIYTFGRTPTWLSSQPGNNSSHYGPGQCAPPTSMQAWDDFVAAIANRAAGNIRYWELWNEPQDGGYYCGDIATMVTMAKHASAILKSIDPNALLLSPSATGPGGPAWLASFLAAGGGNYVDIIAFHGYFSAKAEDIVGVIANYKTVTAANGVGAKPIWDTEASWAGSGNLGSPSPSEQEAFIPKAFLLRWSQGLSRFVWYQYDGSPVYGGLESNGIENSAGASFDLTYRWLVGATMTQACSINGVGTYTCSFSRPGGYTAEVIWNSVAPQLLVVPAQYTQYRDLAGFVHPNTTQAITVGNQPLLVESGSAW